LRDLVSIPSKPRRGPALLCILFIIPMIPVELSHGKLRQVLKLSLGIFQSLDGDIILTLLHPLTLCPKYFPSRCKASSTPSSTISRLPNPPLPIRQNSPQLLPPSLPPCTKTLPQDYPYVRYPHPPFGLAARRTSPFAAFSFQFLDRL